MDTESKVIPPTEQNKANRNLNILPLDDATIEMLAEIERQERDCMISKQSILNHFARQNKLGEGWQLAENRRELVKQAQEVKEL